MVEPKICPCTDPMKKESFFFFIMVIDLLDGGISFIFSLISLCCFCGPRNFHSGFFRCWAVTRIVIQCILLAILSIIFIASWFVKVGNFNGILAQKAVFICIILLLILFVTWNLYLSFQYLNAIAEYQDNKEGLPEEVLADDKKVELNNPRGEVEGQKVDKA